MRMRIRVNMLGGFSISTAGRPQAGLARPYRALIGYMVANRSRPVLREELAERVWTDSDGAHARRSLSTALWRMRERLECAPLLKLDGERLSFNWAAPAWVDAVAMDLRLLPYRRRRPEQLAPDDLRRIEQGVQLYRGDFLQGLDAEWAQIERQRLRDLYLDSLYGLTVGHAAQRSWTQAIAAGRRLAAEEPLREDVHRHIMRAYLALGARAQAIAQFRTCERRLSEEIGVQPMAETLALYREIARRDPPAAHPVAAPRAGVEEARRRIDRARTALAIIDRQLDRTLRLLDAPEADAPPP
jgi:DNA-binding SARP family transcriptional activator